MSTFLRQYLTVAIFGAAAGLLVVLLLGLGSLVRPSRPQHFMRVPVGFQPAGTSNLGGAA